MDKIYSIIKKCNSLVHKEMQEEKKSYNFWCKKSDNLIAKDLTIEDWKVKQKQKEARINIWNVIYKEKYDNLKYLIDHLESFKIKEYLFEDVIERNDREKNILKR